MLFLDERKVESCTNCESIGLGTIQNPIKKTGVFAGIGIALNRQYGYFGIKEKRSEVVIHTASKMNSTWFYRAYWRRHE